MPSICDVKGITVGTVTDHQALTGCTVLLFGREGAVCGVDVKGSAPGTRETDLLAPINMVEKIHGILLAGGSAFGLDAASGVMQFLEEQGIGHYVGPTVVPIVPAAVIFDLMLGDYRVRPDHAMGYAACQAAGTEVQEGNYGAGAGASVGKISGHNYATKSGQGTWSIRFNNGLVVGALAVVNAFGDVYDLDSSRILAGVRDDEGNLIGTAEVWRRKKGRVKYQVGTNTTIAVVACNARFSKARMTKIAQVAQNGLGRVIRPTHTMSDGDTVFAVATGEIEADINLVAYLAQEALARAIVRGVQQAVAVKECRSWQD